MGLDDYIKKRKFNSTPEPEGEYDKADSFRFVIQRHQASHLHYDLRLEMEGVLKSWAVPKGPSMNPDDKRLAIQTEDHPVKYLTFQGTIPKGNYGAGTMQIWDDGIYNIIPDKNYKTASAQLKKGDLKLEFFGRKIKGTFALVKMRTAKEQNQWLLIKKQDEFSTDLEYNSEVFAAKPNSKKTANVLSLKPSQLLKPMLASPAKKIFNDPDWIYEIKWDGYRVLSQVMNGEAALYSRNGISYNQKFAAIKEELDSLPHDVIIDGEMVIVDKNGVPDFQKLQNYNPAQSTELLRYFVFDLLYLNGHDMLQLPLLERKSLLPDVLEGLKNVLFCDHVEDMGSTFYKRAVDAGLEGVIAKKKDSLYFPGTRSENWLKIKAVQTEDCIICGYTESTKGGTLFGSLILGMLDNGQLKYVGNCGSGFSDELQKKLLKMFEPYISEESPFLKKINLKGRKQVLLIPEIFCEVKFSEWTKNGVMRHPVFKSIREDKSPEEVVDEQHNEEPTRVSNTSKNNSSSIEIDGFSVPISNLDKIYWPDSGLRKYDLIDYYSKMAETILPYLKDRPENLHRHPNGIAEPGFYQKDNETLPDWIETIPIFSESSNKNIEYLLCQNEATLIYMANLGCIEINPWNSRISNLNNPDYTVIDLDPSEKNTFEEVIETAQVAKEILDSADIPGLLKTSGSSGLHIYIPLGAKYTYDEARDFTKLLCYLINEKLPDLTSMDRAIKNRKGKLYLDYLQNRRGQTLAAPYCVRPRKGATVSTPLAWPELKQGLKISDYNIHTVLNRINENGDLFSAVLKEGIDMESILAKINDL